MASKDIVAAIAFAVTPPAMVSSIGNAIHCEIHGGQCLMNAPDQQHIEPGDIGTVTLQVPVAVNVTITPDTGALGLNGNAAIVETGDLGGGLSHSVSTIFGDLRGRLPNDEVADFAMNDQDEEASPMDAHVYASAPVQSEAPKTA